MLEWKSKYSFTVQNWGSLILSTLISRHFEIFVSFSPGNRTSHFHLETVFDASCKVSSMEKMEIIFMKCQILFFGKNKKNITILLSVEFAQRMLKVKK